MANQEYNLDLNIEWLVENNIQKHVRGTERVVCGVHLYARARLCWDGEGSKEQGGAGLIGCE